jgi:hypothetical protein
MATTLHEQDVMWKMLSIRDVADEVAKKLSGTWTRYNSSGAKVAFASPKDSPGSRGEQASHGRPELSQRSNEDDRRKRNALRGRALSMGKQTGGLVFLEPEATERIL